MDDKALWLAVRRALLLIAAAIEARYGLRPNRPTE
jgi:hypothetical protein